MDPFYEEFPQLNGAKTWLYCINQQVDIQEISKPHPVDMHYHEYIELLYSLKSGAHIWLGEKCYPFSTGTLAIIPSREPHDLTYEDNSMILCVKFSPFALYVDADSTFGLQYMFPFLSATQQKYFFYAQELKDTPVYSCALDIWKEWAEKKTGYELNIRGDLLRIFAAIFRNFPSETNTLYTSEKLWKTLIYLSNHANTATEAEAAQVCGLSYHHFSAFFKKATSRTFKDYLLELKLHNAKNMLITTNASITQIAFETGFSSASHFISHFHKHTGQTPKQFRDRCLQKHHAIFFCNE